MTRTGIYWGPGQGNTEHLPSSASHADPASTAHPHLPAPPPPLLPAPQSPARPAVPRGHRCGAAQLPRSGSEEGWSAGRCRLNGGASLPRVHERPPVQTALDALRRLIPDRSRSEAQLQPPAAGAEDAPGLCLGSPAPGNRDRTIGLRSGRRKAALAVSRGGNAAPAPPNAELPACCHRDRTKPTPQCRVGLGGVG